MSHSHDDVFFFFSFLVQAKNFWAWVSLPKLAADFRPYPVSRAAA